MLSPSHLAFISHKIHALTNYRPPKAHRCQLREVSFSGTYRPSRFRGYRLGLSIPILRRQRDRRCRPRPAPDSSEGPLLVARLGIIALGCNCTQNINTFTFHRKSLTQPCTHHSCPRHLKRSTKVSKPQDTPHFSYYLMY